MIFEGTQDLGMIFRRLAIKLTPNCQSKD